RVTAEFVSQAYFPMLDVRAAIGRVFRPEEDEVPQRNAVVVISDGLWKRRFGGDPGVVGRSILLNDQPFTGVGVMPTRFRGVYDSSDAWLPFMMAVTPQSITSRGTRGPWAVAKLKPGVSLQQAQSEMTAISQRLEQAWPASNEARGVEISPLETEL